MEDVFLRVSPEKPHGDQDDMDTKGVVKNGHPESNHDNYANGFGHHDGVTRSNPERSYNRLTGLELWLGQMRGLLTKRAIYTVRRWLLYAGLVRKRTSRSRQKDDRNCYC